MKTIRFPFPGRGKRFSPAAAAVFAAALILCPPPFKAIAATPEQRRSAESGDAAAQMALARDFLYGMNGERRNPATGYFWLRKAAASGGADALYNLGYCHEFGLGTAVDPAEAYRCYEQAAAKNLAPARFKLAEILKKGIPSATVAGVYRRGVEADPERVKTLLNDLVREEYPPALVLLAEGLIGGASKDNANAAKAVELLRKAADAGDIMAMRLLADCLYRGFGTKVDHEKMVFYLEQAANRGDAESLAFLGMAYEYGLGLRPDPDKAFDLTKRAAEAGVPTAELRLADYYFTGMYVPTDVPRALDLLRRAADKNDPRAAFRLGNCYANGIGVERDDEAAFDCYLRGAAAGEPNAQFALALAFREGAGTPKDPSAVRYWLKKAADGGSKEAELLLSGKTPSEADREKR